MPALDRQDWLQCQTWAALVLASMHESHADQRFKHRCSMEGKVSQNVDLTTSGLYEKKYRASAWYYFFQNFWNSLFLRILLSNEILTEQVKRTNFLIKCTGIFWTASRCNQPCWNPGLASHAKYNAKQWWQPIDLLNPHLCNKRYGIRDDITTRGKREIRGMISCTLSPSLYGVYHG